MARLQSGNRAVKLEGIATPTDNTDAANKAYVDGQSLDLEANSVAVTRRSIANFDPVFTVTDDSTNSKTIIDIADGGIATNHIANNAVTNDKMADDSVGANEFIDNSVGADALNVSGNGSTGQFLESDGDGSMSWTTPDLNTNSDVTISSPASEHMLSYNATNSQWENSQVLQVEDVAGTPTLTHVFGRRLDTPLAFETFSFDTNSSAAPRSGSLLWDQPLQSLTYNNVNNDNFQDVFVNRLTAARLGTDTNLSTFPQNIDSNYVSTFTRTLTPSNVDSSVDLARDPRTGAYNGSASPLRTLTVTMATNEATPQTTTVGQSWGWSQAGIISANSNPGNLRFDGTNSSYTVTIVVRPSIDGASNISSVGLTSPSLGTAPALQAGVAGSQYNVTVTNGVTIYHDTSVTGGTTATFTRPTTVSTESASNRAFTDTGSFTVNAPTTLYPTWTVRAPNGTAFDTTTPTNTLGALSSDGYAGTGVTGHTIALARSGDSSTATWKDTNYGFNNSAGTAPVRFMIVAPSTTTGFTQPLSLGAAAVPDNTRTVQLGHSGHTVTYTVYEFTIGAGANFEVNPA